jgi:hypothetical protein
MWLSLPEKKYQVKQQQKCIRSRHRHRQTDRHKVRRSWTLYIWSKILRFTDDIVRTPQTTTVSQSVTDTIVFSLFLPFLKRRRFTAPGIFFLNWFPLKALKWTGRVNSKRMIIIVGILFMGKKSRHTRPLHVAAAKIVILFDVTTCWLSAAAVYIYYYIDAPYNVVYVSPSDDGGGCP